MCETNADKLYAAVLSLKDARECESLFSDLCTKKEIQDFVSRLEVARLLSEGVNYNEIARITGASTATISRVSKCLSGEAGGYRLVLPRIYATDSPKISIAVSSYPWCITAYEELRKIWAELPALPREVGEISGYRGISVALLDPRDSAALFCGGGYELFLGSALDLLEEGAEYREVAPLRGCDSLVLGGVEKNAKIASAYPNLTRAALRERGITASVTRARSDASPISIGAFDAVTEVRSGGVTAVDALVSAQHALIGRVDLSEELLVFLAEKLGK